MAHTIRDELGTTPDTAGGEAVLAMVHVTDPHILDAGSPARCEWVELEAADPRWQPLLHMHRPYEALTAFALDAHVASIREHPIAAVTQRPIDLVVSTGDNLDNAQRNELDMYLALMSGGTARLSAVGSAQDSSSARCDTTGPAPTWPFWSPDGAVGDGWRSRGYPVVDDFVHRASQPIVSRGLGLPWTGVPGNHDLLRQGTALTNAALEDIATSSAKSLQRPERFNPDDPRALFLSEPQAFSAGAEFRIAAEPDRRAIGRQEWIDAHRAAGALGFTDTRAGSGQVDTVVDTDVVRLVLLDTNHPAGDYQGSVGAAQLQWLDERLAEVDREPGRIAILVSHHGADTLTNQHGDRQDRRLADDLLTVVHRHRCVAAWLTGHRHLNRIEPRRAASGGGGFWEITTSSTIDWPSEVRSVEVVRHRDGNFEIVCTMLDHGGDPDSLAHLHRRLARLFVDDVAAARMAGRDLDRDVRLGLPARR